MSTKALEKIDETNQVMDIMHLLQVSDIHDPILKKAIHKMTILPLASSALDILEKIVSYDTVVNILEMHGAKLMKSNKRHPQKPSEKDRLRLSQLTKAGMHLHMLTQKYSDQLLKAINDNNQISLELIELYKKYTPAK